MTGKSHEKLLVEITERDTLQSHPVSKMGDRASVHCDAQWSIASFTQENDESPEWCFQYSSVQEHRGCGTRFVLHLRFPWMGSRSLRDQLSRAGVDVGRDRVRRLMRRMGIHAVYRKPRTCIPALTHTVYPYVLRDLDIDRPNQVWAADVTYLTMARGALPGGGYGLAQPQGAGLATVERADGRLLCRGTETSVGALRAVRRSSAPIRAASSPAGRLPKYPKRPALPSARTARAGRWTTFSRVMVTSPPWSHRRAPHGLQWVHERCAPAYSSRTDRVRGHTALPLDVGDPAPAGAMQGAGSARESR
ncbi:MAG: IS3 family transposase [Gammaproteobacteria bacterium]|nr:IS3 family transposase [Gammaproteobacteria bacterium]